jgi:hypothetical protein
VLAGAEVVVVADADDAGRKHADEVVRSLRGLAASVRVVEPAAGKDASDHLAAGMGLEDLKAMTPEQGEPLELAAVLDMTEMHVRRYVAMTEAQYVGVTLWVAHTHVLAATSTTPYLHATSPEPESGKSRLLECVEQLTPGPMYAANLTAAVLFRVVQQLSPTLLVDEVDNLMSDREAKGELLGAGPVADDIKQVFEDRGDPAELTSADLLGELVGLDESPWRGWWGIDNKDGEVVVSKGAAQKLSRHLKALRITSSRIGPKDKRIRGYRRADFEDLWRRYLPVDSSQPPPHPGHPGHSASQSQKPAAEPRTPDPPVSDLGHPENGSTEPSVQGVQLEAGDSGNAADLDPSLDDYAARFTRHQAEGRWGR